MNSPFLVGFGAGLVSAVLFASAATGSVLALGLLYLAPLPTLLAGLGWGWLGAAAAGLTGSALILIALGITPAFAYFVSLGLPAVVLCYLALLSRQVPAAPGSAQTTPEWYPPGRLVAWATVMAGGLTVLSIVVSGMDDASLQATIAQKLDEIVAALGPRAPVELDKEALARLAAFIARAAPAATSVVWLLIMLLNMLAAGRIVEVSGRALRPWPDLSAMTYPPLFALGAAVAFAAAFSTGTLGAMATAFAGAFVLAYLLLGLIIVHVLTRASPFRAFLLVTVYLAIMFLGWAALIVAMLGLCDPIFKLRRRVAPPPNTPGTGID